MALGCSAETGQERLRVNEQEATSSSRLGGQS